MFELLERLARLGIPDDQVLSASGNDQTLVRRPRNAADDTPMSNGSQALFNGIGTVCREGISRLCLEFDFPRLDWSASPNFKWLGLRLPPQVVRPEDLFSDTRQRVPESNAPQIVPRGNQFAVLGIGHRSDCVLVMTRIGKRN